MSETKQNRPVNSFFSFLYRTRIKISKGSTPILNLSLIAVLLCLLFAPWLVLVGCVAALALGYRFAVARNDPDFLESLRSMVNQAPGNVKSAVSGLAEKDNQEK